MRAEHSAQPDRQRRPRVATLSIGCNFRDGFPAPIRLSSQTIVATVQEHCLSCFAQLLDGSAEADSGQMLRDGHTVDLGGACCRRRNSPCSESRPDHLQLEDYMSLGDNPFHQLRLERLCFWRSIPVDRHHSRGSHVCRDRFAKPADKREIRTHPASGFPWRVNVASYYYQREIPRLCRGGSRSLTFPGVHPETLRREPPSTRRGETGWTSMPA